MQTIKIEKLGMETTKSESHSTKKIINYMEIAGLRTDQYMPTAQNSDTVCE